MIEAALLFIVFKHVSFYYLFNERFTESLWLRQLGLSFMGVLLFGTIAILFPISEYPDRRHDFAAPCLFVISFIVEYLLYSLIKPVRRSVGQVIMSTHNFKMNRALLRSRTFIAIFSIYLLLLITASIFVVQSKETFIYP